MKIITRFGRETVVSETVGAKMIKYDGATEVKPKPKPKPKK